MQKNKSRLTVFFDDPYWVGVYERVTGGRLEACKITFGAEPKDYEVHQFLLEHWHRLRFSPAVAATEGDGARKNPKRLQREITRQLAQKGVGTKSQQALALQREEGKAARRRQSRQERQADEQRRFQLRQQKKKQKKKGR